MERHFPAQMQLSYALKDANLALEEAEGTELSILNKIADFWDEAAADSYADQELAGVYACLAG
ncbi:MULTISPECIES: hypothetical protein [unclassified Raoultella]|uniref:hypothetical protein n=1 Tax=unclassified Raoultella TaxID=2627600 RepID=UPI0013585867|nr:MULTISPECIES: hypothetical protein [unclassified Raoultella]